MIVILHYHCPKKKKVQQMIFGKFRHGNYEPELDKTHAEWTSPSEFHTHEIQRIINRETRRETSI
jgi:hypothetical protein